MSAILTLYSSNIDGKNILYLITEDWYFWSHRLPVARAARDAGAKIIVATHLTDHATEIEKEGFSICHIPFDRSRLNPIKDLHTFYKILWCYVKHKPDIVHHVGVKPIAFGHIAASLLRVPAIVNAIAGAGFLFTSRSKKAGFFRWLFEFSMKHAMRRGSSRLIVQNEDDRQLFLAIGVDGQKITLIPGSGVDCSRFQPVTELEGTPIAVCVSRMLRDKGIFELVEAATILRERKVLVKVRLVGGTDVNPSSVSETQLQVWREQGTVEVLGQSSDIAGEYARAHIAVLPSYREGLPKSLLEAASCGKPIVTTDVPGCRAICTDGENGLLVPPRDPQALANALAQLATDLDLRVRMGLAGRQRVLAEFSQDIIAEKTLNLYNRIITK